MAVRFDRVGERADDLLFFRVVGCLAEILGHGASGDRPAFPMQESGIQQAFHQRTDPSDPYQFRHHVMPGWAQVRDHGHFAADPREVIQRKAHAHGASHGQQVQDDIGGTAQGGRHGDGIEESLARHDVAGGDAELQQLDRHLAGLAAISAFGLGGCHLCRTARQAHAQRFNCRGHGVGGVHAAARPGSGDGARLDCR